MINFFVASYTFVLSLLYQRTLKIKWKDRKRYWHKNIGLTLCYRGFSPWNNWKSLSGAARAGFYCCAYDVLTDWRHFSESDFEIFKKLFSKLDKELQEIVFKLYSTEKNNQPLKNDGLERGIIALRFISKLMNVENYIESHTDFEELGTVMQIVDDAEDIEEDKKYGDTNCLFSERKNIYIQKLLDFNVSKFKEIFPNSSVLVKEITKAQRIVGSIK
jgi:hypothetical protein